MQKCVQNQLSLIRQRRGISASDLAKKIGVSRQTIYAIEAGTYVPNTEVALKLARQLDVSVEELFSLHLEESLTPETVHSEVLSANAISKGQAVRFCHVGERLVSIPVNASPYYLPEADGVVTRFSRSTRKTELAAFTKDVNDSKKLVLAGCDPAIGLVAQMVKEQSGVEIIPAAASSKLALSWLNEDKVHIAGSHLEDAKTGEFNLPFLQQEFPNEDFTVVTFARWDEGLVVAQGNPKQIHSITDLARKEVSLINRETGSGSRTLMDRLLRTAGIPFKKVVGYERVAYGHLAAAYAVLTSDADCCLATQAAAKTFGLDFISLQSERYDLIMRRQTLELPAVQTFLDILQRASLRRKLEVLAGYETSQTGMVLA